MDATRQVVITGIGVVSPIGIGIETFWNSLQNSQSGISTLDEYIAAGLPVTVGAKLKDFDPKQFVRPRKSLKVMCREMQTAFSAANLAMHESGLPCEDLAPERIGTVFGSEMFYGAIDEYADLYRSCLEKGQFLYDRFGENFGSKMTPLWMLKYLPNMPACHVAIAHDARGPNNSIVLGDASSLLAVIEATSVIKRGAADVVICGGTGSRLSVTGVVYRGYESLSQEKDPQIACRPFDAQRSGMVNGEGAACFILESLEFAKRRKAKILCRISGYGSSVSMSDSAADRCTAIKNSIRQSLATSQLVPADIGHINAHGLGTIEDDITEALAIQETLDQVPVTALKGYFGNLGASGGAVEMAATVLALQSQIVPATVGFQNPDPKCPVNIIQGEAAKCSNLHALTLSQSGTGQAVAIALSADV